MALKSRNDVLWFCLVLLVEVFGLSVALGGPWIEVSYFLLVVVSQTVAGAYIWAHLRKHEQQLPIPELLAMGFAIGSSSAAISQLILRDLLGIRLMISPYVPIIAVAIWLLVKRSPKLGVEITHTDSTTLLWLLFPAPLAMSYFVVELLPVFVVPLTIFALAASSKRFKNHVVDLDNRRFELVAVLFVLLLTIATAFTSTLLRTFSVAISLIGNDELYDFAHARGFAQWGIQENINVVGETFSYYKLSHLWLGPIVDQLSPDAILITTSILPLFLYLLIGSSLWSLTKRVFNSRKVANVAAVLIFAQSALPEPYVIERRPLYLFAALFLIAILIMVFATSDTRGTYQFLIFLSSFLMASIRVQYAAVVISGILLFELRNVIQRRRTAVSLISTILMAMLGFALSYAVFFRLGTAQTSYLTRPDLFPSLRTVFEALALRVLAPVTIFYLLKSRRTNQFLEIVSVSALIFLFFVPSYSGERYPIEIILIISIPICAAVLVQIIEQNWENYVYYICSFSFALGSASRILYEINKWRDPEALVGIQLLIYRITTDSSYLPIFVFVPIGMLSLLAFGFARDQSERQIRMLAVGFCIFSYTFGVFISTEFRSVTTSLRYGTAIFSADNDTTARWLTSDEFKSPIDYLLKSSDREDVIATNVHRYDEDYSRFGSSMVLSSNTGRRFFLEAPFFDRKNIDDFISVRMQTSLLFPEIPSNELLDILTNAHVRWFVVDLERTNLRDWEPWATTRFINDKVAILELATDIEG